MIARLTILYDPGCGFCVRCRFWLAKQAQLVGLEFLPLDATEIGRRFPELAELALDDELVVVSDTGGVYWGAPAYLMCLWALDKYREWSYRLASPALLPFARYAFNLISKKRLGLSTMLGWEGERRLADKLRRERRLDCPTCS